MFKEQLIDLGIVKIGQQHTVSFDAEEGVSDVQINPPDCTCINPHWDEEKRQIIVTYKAKPVPKHLTLLNLSHYHSLKSLTVSLKFKGEPQLISLNIKAEVHA